MQLQGIAAAVVLLVAISAIRMGDKPTFRTDAARDTMVKQITDAVKAQAKSGKSTYVDPRR